MAIIYLAGGLLCTLTYLAGAIYGHSPDRRQANWIKTGNSW
jgi:hypothetical protein